MKLLPLISLGALFVGNLVASDQSAQWSSTRSAKLSSLSIRGGVSHGSPYELNPKYQPYVTKMASSKLHNSKPQSRVPGGYTDHLSQQRPQTEYFVKIQTYGANAKTLGSLDSSRSSDYASILDSAWRYCSVLFQRHPTIAYVATSCIVISLLWRVRSFQPILERHFVCSRRNFRQGHVSVLLLSAISHVSWLHLFFNLATLLSMGPTVQSVLASTNSPIWPLMLGSALVSSSAYLAFGSPTGCLGLSGVTLSLVAMQARIFPRRIMGIQLFGIFPVRMPAHVLLNVLLLWSAMGSFMRTSNVAHVTHLGGLLFGMAYHEYWRSQKSRRGFPFP